MIRATVDSYPLLILLKLRTGYRTAWFEGLRSDVRLLGIRDNTLTGLAIDRQSVNRAIVDSMRAEGEGRGRASLECLSKTVLCGQSRGIDHTSVEGG